MNQTGNDAQTELLGGQDSPADATVEAMLAPGTRLDRYRIVRVLGRGGMGEVYLADQIEPVRRRVALKLLHRQRMDPQHLLRFELERQVLAQMRHPSIAQIYDAGTTAEGHPYFVMEYIDGQPINQWCDQHKIGLDERLALFIRVCEGVQHAHQKGVIHRDLKPGNVLVTEVDGRALPKIIDFGIASASEDGAAETAGTPDYMSPEQSGGGSLDTRSDVYALGVMLHELLTGLRPERAGETVTDSQHASRRPSDRLRTLSAADVARLEASQGVKLSTVSKLLSDELDWVIDKALKHDRDERYGSVAALVADIQRYLANQPVLAVPQTRAYIWGTFVTRHRVAVVAGVIVVLALVAGLLISLYGLREAQVQRALAESRSAELEKVAAFQQSMLEDIDIESMGRGLRTALQQQAVEQGGADADRLQSALLRLDTSGLARNMIERDMLAAADSAISRDFAGEPKLAADLRSSVGKVRSVLGLYESAADDFARVAAFREQHAGLDDREAMHARQQQAVALIRLGRAKDAFAVLEPVATRAQAQLAPGDDVRGEILLSFGEAAGGAGDMARARQIHQALYQERLAAKGADDSLALRAQNNVGVSYLVAREFEQARPVFEGLVEHYRRLGQEDSEMGIGVRGNLGAVYAETGDLGTAIEIGRGMLDTLVRKYGAEHPITLSTRNNLALDLVEQGELDEGIALLSNTLEARTRVLGAEHPQTLSSKMSLATNLLKQGQIERGLDLMREASAQRERVLGERNRGTINSQLLLIQALQNNGYDAEAKRLRARVMPIAIEVLGKDNPAIKSLASG